MGLDVHTAGVATFAALVAELKRPITRGVAVSAIKVTSIR